MKTAFAPKRAKNPYATHLPVLVGLSQLLQVKRVIEFGAGLYSTLTFLDQATFPELVTLHSFENDPVWLDEINNLVGDDPRLRLILVDGPMSSVISKIRFQDYDLVFLDDSFSAEARSTTISQVAHHCDPSNVIVIHDYEMKVYRDAIQSLPHGFTMNALNPHTGIAWSRMSISKRRLKELNKLIKNHASLIPLENLRDWLAVISENRF